MTFGEKLQRLMDDSGDSQAKLGASVGAVQSTVFGWLAGEYKPKTEKSLAIARHYGVTLEFLLDDTIDWPPTTESHLTADEIYVLETARRLGLDEAIRRMLAMGPAAGQGAGEG